MLLHEERAGPCLVPSNRTLHYRNTGIVTDPCSAPPRAKRLCRASTVTAAGTAQITTQGHRGTFFSGRFQISGDRGTQLLRAIRLREDHSDEKITHHEVGWSPVRNHPINVRGGQVSDWEKSQVLADLAVSELSAALQ